MATRVRHQPRAERYAIPITILYRSAGEPDWRPGLTENVSRSGVLFRVERHIALDTPLELMLELPEFVDAGSGRSVRRGRVVRAVAPSPRERRPAVAATFIDFLHTPTVDPRRI